MLSLIKYLLNVLTEFSVHHSSIFSLLSSNFSCADKKEHPIYQASEYYEILTVREKH